MRGMTPSNAANLVEHVDATLAALVHLADALPDFAVSADFGGASGAEGAAVTDVLARLHGEQLALKDWLATDDTSRPSTLVGEFKEMSQQEHRPYSELRGLVQAAHGDVRDAAVSQDNVEALELLGRRYEWAHSVLGQCAL